MRAAHQLSRISLVSILTTILFVCAIGSAGEAQTQASCTFNNVSTGHQCLSHDDEFRSLTGLPPEAAPGSAL